MRDLEMIKKDRLRYTKNKISSTLAILGILFNVLYFVSVYSSNIGNYYYKVDIGMSVVYNLLFLLFAFLCSEGVKTYNLTYACALIGIGLLQIVRIFYIPMKAHETVISLDGVERLVMDNGQFIWVIVCLSVSAAACVVGGIIAIIKTNTLKNYMKEISAKEE